MADNVNPQITDAVVQTNKKPRLEITLWIIGFVVLSVIDYFVQQAQTGGLPFKVGTAVLNALAFIGTTIRWVMLFGQKMFKNGVPENLPEPPKNDK